MFWGLPDALVRGTDTAPDPSLFWDPEPDPQDPHVLGPTGCISQRDGYGSGSLPFLTKVLGGLK